jgi:hypothetical protein
MFAAQPSLAQVAQHVQIVAAAAREYAAGTCTFERLGDLVRSNPRMSVVDLLPTQPPPDDSHRPQASHAGVGRAGDAERATAQSRTDEPSRMNATQQSLRKIRDLPVDEVDLGRAVRRPR